MQTTIHRRQDITLERVLWRHWCKRLYFFDCEDASIALYRCGKVMVIVLDKELYRRIMLLKGDLMTTKGYSKDNRERELEILDFIDAVIYANKGDPI